MKKLILAAIVAISGWFSTQAQSLPVPEKYNELLEQMVKLEQPKAEFLMQATMETLAKNPKGYRQMLELAERRFSDPADSLHNEGLYMVVLKHATEKFVLSNTEKEKQRLLLLGAQKNMINSEATDFDYITPGSKTVHHLKDLKADNILIYFNNPDCQSCETVKERLANSEIINNLVNQKKLIVLAIYPYNDSKLWKKTKYPKMMINGFNESRQIEYNELYDLPTLPCFYLLDKNYKVLLKNEGSLKKVEKALTDLASAQQAGPMPAPAPTAFETANLQQAVTKEGPQTKAAATPQDQKKLKFEGNDGVPKADRPDPNANKSKHAADVNSVPAPLDDPNVAISEELLSCFINNDTTAIYNSLSEKNKKETQPSAIDGAFSKMESKVGKYLNHEGWQNQNIQGKKFYTTYLHFEKENLGFIVMYDEDGKVSAMSFVPSYVIGK